MAAAPSPPPFSHALSAGALAGVTVDLVFFPVDTIKTRLQSAQGFWASGGFKGIYRGVGSVALGGAPGAAIFFSTYESLKSAFSTLSPSLSPSIVHMLSASGGETAACLIRVPTEVVKSRQQTQAYGAGTSSLRAARIVLAQEGLRGFYRGFGITVFREIPFTSIQFPLYEFLKARVSASAGRARARPWEGAACGMLAGGVAAAATTPLDVIKTRVMLSPTPVSVGKVFRDVWANEGSRALFAGVAPRVAWISAGGAVFLGVYEAALDLIGRR